MTGVSTARCSLAGIAVTVGLLVFATMKTLELTHKVENLIGRQAQPGFRMQTLEETITTSSGRVVTVRTTRADGESVADFLDRHTKVVDAVKLL